MPWEHSTEWVLLTLQCPQYLIARLFSAERRCGGTAAQDSEFKVGRCRRLPSHALLCLRESWTPTAGNLEDGRRHPGYAAWRPQSGLPNAGARRSSRSPAPSRSRGMHAAALSQDGCGATHPRRNSRSPAPPRSRGMDAAPLSQDKRRMTELLRTSRGMRSRTMPQVGCALAERTCAIPGVSMCARRRITRSHLARFSSTTPKDSDRRTGGQRARERSDQHDE